MTRNSLKCGVRLSMLLLAGVFAFTGGAAAEKGEISLLGFYATGDFGTNSDSATRTMTLRYVTGRDYQVRVDLPVVSRDSALGPVHTGLGPVSGGPPTGNGGTGQGSDGSGQGPGGGSGPTDGASQQNDVISVGAGDGREAGLGDVRLAVARRVAGGGIKLFRTDAVLELKVPTADEDAGLGTGEPDARVGVTGEYRFWSATGFGGVGWNRLGDPSWIELNDVFDAFLGVESNPLAGERLIVSGWLEGHEEVFEGPGGRLALGVGLRTTGSRRWRVAITRNVGGSYDETTLLFGPTFGAPSAGPGILGVER
jgi:hypothetical protein